MNKLQAGTLALARASDGNPVFSTLTVMLFWVMFNVLEALVETLMWGKPFEHWFDVVATAAFIAYSAYAVWYCAICYPSLGDRNVFPPRSQPL